MKKVPIIVSLLLATASLVFGWVQNVEAEKNAEEANRQRVLAEAAHHQALANAEEAKRQQAIADELKQVADARTRELDECRKKR